MSKHTPGPWKHQKPRGQQRAIDRKWEVVSPFPEGGELVIVGEHTGIDCLKEADARLIAAAPRMFDRIAKLAADGDAEAISIMEAINGNA